MRCLEYFKWGQNLCQISFTSHWPHCINELVSNKIGYLDLTKQIPYKILLTNKTLNDKPLIFKNNNSYKINVSLIRNNFSISDQGNLLLNNIALSISGMTDSGPKGITYSFNPQIINLTESNKINSLLKLDMIMNDNDDIIQSENNTLMIIANIRDKNNLTTSVSQPLPISIIKPEEFYANSSPLPSSTLAEQQTVTTNHKNYDTIKNSNLLLSEIKLIDIIKYLSLSITIILIGYIVYKKIKNKRDRLKKK